MNDFVALAIVGAAVSVLVQFIKATVSSNYVKPLVIVLSVAAAAGYMLVRDTGFWEPALQVLLFANTGVRFFIKPFEE